MPSPVPPKIAPAALTRELKKLAAEVIAVDDAGGPITREQALAKTLWDMANGYVERTRDDHGNLKEIVYKPVPWAIQYVFERIEGRAATVIAEDRPGMRAAEKVSELARERLNKLAGAKK